MIRVTMSFCPDLTDPTAESVPIASVTIADHTVTMEWLERPFNTVIKSVDVLTRDLIRSFKHCLESEVRDFWRRFPHADEDQIVNYICACYRMTTLFVSDVVAADGRTDPRWDADYRTLFLADESDAG